MFIARFQVPNSWFLILGSWFLFPLLLGHTQCKLMCRSEGEDFMVSRGSKFIDGTRCEADWAVDPGTVTACLEGLCEVRGDGQVKENR